jgi:flagellar brake protein
VALFALDTLTMSILNDALGIQDLSPYQIGSRREILALLRTIINRKQSVRMLVDGVAEAIVTALLEIRENDNTLLIDYIPQALASHRQDIINSHNISFETVLDHIRILFFSTGIEEATRDGLSVYRLSIPSSVIRLQRREFYRVTTPATAPLRCSIQIPHAEGEYTATLTLQNVSGGGIGLIDEHGEVDCTVGRIYHNCRIYLPGNTIITTALQIKNAYDHVGASGKKSRRIGCLFIDLPKPMMAAVHRFITKLEREQNARAMGRE